MRVFDVAGKSAIYYPHHEGAKVIAKCLCDENGRAPLTSQMRMLNEECALPFTIHNHGRSIKFY